MDPWDWSTDEVVVKLCRSRNLWMERPHSKLPDPAQFEAVLRENDINGATLLVHVNTDVLKDDMQIKSLGERAAILDAIETLRTRSPQYVSCMATIESRQNKIKHDAVAWSSATPPQSNSADSPMPAIVEGDSPACNLADTEFTVPESHHDPERRFTTTLSRRDSKPRIGEYLITKDGVKRRKLLLVPAVDAADASFGQTKPPGELAAELAHNYLDHNSMPINKLFYSESHSQLLNDDPAWSDATEFSIQSGGRGRLCNGEKVFVNRRMQHFLRSEGKKLDRLRMVRYPYPEHLVSDKIGGSAMLFNLSDGGVIMTKRDAALISLDVIDGDGDSTEDVDVDHSFDYLVTKYPSISKGNEVSSLDSENESDEDAQDERDKVSSPSSNAETSQELQDIENRNIIFEEISKFRDEWSYAKLPRRQNKAWTVWKQAQGRRRTQTIDAARIALEKLGIRLQKLIDELSGHHWTNAKALRKQCCCLQPTVEDIQDHEWKFRLWESTIPPRRLSKATSKPLRSLVPRHLGDSDGGESISSESDGLDDFMDVDDAEISETEKQQLHETENHAFVPTLETLPSASQIDLDGAPFHPLPLSHERHASRESEPRDTIDLTFSSPSPSRDDSADDLFVEGKRVENSTNYEISAWDWRDLDEEGNRKRIILKHLMSMDDNLRKKLQLCFANKDLEQLKGEVQRALGAIKRGNIDFIPDMNTRNYQTAIATGKLFACWNDGCHRHFTSEIPASVITSAIKAKDFPSFYSFVKSLSAIANESESDSDVIGPSPRKKRKNKVLKDHSAQVLRKTAQARQDEGEVRTLKLKNQMATSSLREGDDKIIVNTMKEEHEELIFLNRHISERVKPHQIDGIRFLWREIVSVGQSSVMQGCLLAHTMGLGKTMQTISLLVTIAEAAASSNPNIVNQIPTSLQKSRTLILCPGGLVENWKDEFQSWLPPGIKALGAIFDIAAQNSLQERLDTLCTWHEDGGILIMGYEIFRRLSCNGASNEVEQNLFRTYLLGGPNIVVADEAHKLKHQTSAISKVVGQFRTPSRIALTGSPLANNLQDYYVMIDWVAAGYLGGLVEFKADYQEPIEAGTYADSTEYEQRRSLKKLRALLSDIAPKVNRADISAIQSGLSKTEFVIKLPLTHWQRSAYASFVKSILNKSYNQIVQEKLFDWMNFLSLLCTHPSIFLDRLLERADQKAEEGRRRDSLDATSMPVDDDTTRTIKVPDDMAKSQQQIVQELDIDNPYAPMFSFKTLVIAEILLQSKHIGDRVLVFSQHRPTLDHLDRLIRQLPGNIASVRLDGRTKISDRPRLVKDFNSGKGDVFLISTKAGGLGLNISGANRVIIVDFNFNPSHEEQAIGRAYRIGQQKEVFVYHLVTGGTYEETLHNIGIFKRQLAARVVDRKNPTRSASKGQMYLFEPRNVPQQNLDGFKGKDIIMDRLLESEIGACVRGLKTAETMHAETKEDLTEEEEREVQEMIAVDKLRKTDPVAWGKMRLAEPTLFLDPMERKRLAEQTRLFAAAHSQYYAPLYQLTNTETEASRYQQPIEREPRFAGNQLLVQEERFAEAHPAVTGPEKSDGTEGNICDKPGEDPLRMTQEVYMNEPC